MDKEIKAIFFDLSEVLIDTKSFFKRKSYHVNKHILNTFGFNKNLKEIKKAIYKTYHETEKYWRKGTPFSFILCKNLGLYVNEKIAKKMDSIFRKEFVKNIKLKPNVKWVLSKLKEYTLGVISNYDTLTNKAILNRFKINVFFKIVVGIDTTGKEKAKIAPYLYALKRLKLKGNQTVMVGDDERQDIIPAKSIGMKTIKIVKNLKEKTCADFKIRNLKEVILILHKNFQ